YAAYLQAAYRGFAKRAYGPLASTLKGYDPNMFHYQTDLNKAKALWQQASIPSNTTLTLMYQAGEPAEKLAGPVMAGPLPAIGINLTLQGVTQQAQNDMYFGNTPPSKRPNLQVYGWWPDYNDPWDESVVLVDSASGGPNGANIGYYHNKQVDALLDNMKLDD